MRLFTNERNRISEDRVGPILQIEAPFTLGPGDIVEVFPGSEHEEEGMIPFSIIRKDGQLYEDPHEVFWTSDINLPAFDDPTRVTSELLEQLLSDIANGGLLSSMFCQRQEPVITLVVTAQGEDDGRARYPSFPSVESSGLEVMPQANQCDGSVNAPYICDNHDEDGSYDRMVGVVESASASNCLNAQASEADLWADWSMEQRANRIYEISDQVISRLRSESSFQNPDGTRSRPSGGRWQRLRHIDYYYEEHLGPELISCIAFQETRGFLLPEMFNYTSCESQTSYAIGLGQLTPTTMGDYMSWSADSSDPERNYIAATIFSEEENARINSLSLSDLRREMLTNVPLQIEIMFRILNYKIIEKSDIHNTTLETVFEGVEYYDQDKPRDYMQNIRSCYSCMTRAGSTPYSCYQEVF